MDLHSEVLGTGGKQYRGAQGLRLLWGWTCQDAARSDYPIGRQEVKASFNIGNPNLYSHTLL